MTKKIEKVLTTKGVKTSRKVYEGDLEANQIDKDFMPEEAPQGTDARNETGEGSRTDGQGETQEENGTGTPENGNPEDETKPEDGSGEPGQQEQQPEQEQDQKQQQFEDEMSTYPKGVLHAVVASIKNNQPLLLVGHTGTGKTTIIKAAARVWEKELFRINLNGQTGREDIVGKYVLRDGATEWVDGLLLRAMKEGHWILFDELNVALPEVQFVLQALIERDSQAGTLGAVTLTEKHGEKITPHPEFRLFATCNPPSYVGLKDMNTATLSRYIVANVETMPVDQAERHFGPLYPEMTTYIRVLYTTLGKLLNLFLDGDLSYCASARDLDHIGTLMQGGLSLEDAIQFGLLNKYIDPDESKTAKEVLSHHVEQFKTYLEQLKESSAIELRKQKTAAEKVKFIREHPLMDDKTYAATMKFFTDWSHARIARKEAEEKIVSLTQ